MPIPFVSAQDLSDLLAQDVTADPRTVIALDSACQIVRSYLGQLVNLVEDDEVRLDGSGQDALLLPELPVVEVTTVIESDGTTDTTLTEDEDYIVGGAGILWRVGQNWCYGKRNITVTYSHGWSVVEPPFSLSDPDLETVPTDIRRVALEVAARSFAAAASGGLTSENIGDYAYTKSVQAAAGGLLDGEMRMLDAYRVRGTG